MDLNMQEKAMLCDILMCFIPVVFIIQQEMQYTQSKTQYSKTCLKRTLY